MTRIALFRIFTMISILFFMPSQIIAKPTDMDSEAMKQVGRLYQERCMFCHGVKGDGNGEIAKNLAIKPRNFTNYNEMRHLFGDKETIEDTIRRGKSGIMPAFEGDLNRSEIKALALYVQSFLAQEQFLINMCVGSVARFEHMLVQEFSILESSPKLPNGQSMFSVTHKKSGFLEITTPLMLEMRLFMMLKSTHAKRAHFVIREGNINVTLVTVRAHFPCPEYLKKGGATIQKQF